MSELDLGLQGLQDLKSLLRDRNPSFWASLAQATRSASRFDALLFLSSLRRRAVGQGFLPPVGSAEPLRLAILGGYSLYPTTELVEHFLAVEGVSIELLTGDFDSYTSEIADPRSRLYEFRPQLVCILPSPRLARPTGGWHDAREALEAEGRNVVASLLELCSTAHQRTGCEVVLANFPLPGRHDLGQFRGKTLASEWSFKRFVNLELGLSAPAHVRVLDLEFLTNRLGALSAADDRAWFESKQPGSPQLLVCLARELAQLATSTRRPPKKVLVLDLDNTVWGGIIGDDGIGGIEIGDTSPRGEAFKAFQRYVKSLTTRGVLLAVCSKNDEDRAKEPFTSHPEMVLRLEDFAAFTANWEPKADNIRQMAADLNLGLDSFVFVDDNAAEVEMVRQFAPEVTSIHLGPDPAEYCAILQDARLFEPSTITAEDAKRTAQYRTERERRSALASAVDMDAYLASLDMQAVVRSFTAVDAPRIAQLINKSNQFNLTTRRRTEAEVSALMDDPSVDGFTVRLSDRFGDHGLISVIIGRTANCVMEIDTWLMSCRVLKRRVEDLVLNELMRRAKQRGCTQLRGTYLPTAKNGMVRDHFVDLGFETILDTTERREFSLPVESYAPRNTPIRLVTDPQ